LNRLSRTLFAVSVVAALCAPVGPSREPSAAAAPAAAEGQSHLPTLKPSNILGEVMRRKALRPALSAAGLARYANALLARRGFDYDFDVCEIFPTTGPSAIANVDAGATITFDHRLTHLDGRGVTFRFVTDNQGAPCSFCFLSVPALRVTKGEMHVVSGGVTYVLRRPAVFALDEAHLLDEGMKKVLRTWQLPFQTIPAGVSPDGKSLYLNFYESSGLDELVLEISDDGRPRFRAAAEVPARGGEWIDKQPGGALDDDDRDFIRFRAGGRSHVVRFTGPCT
jgi:hypothetical protein